MTWEEVFQESLAGRVIKSFEGPTAFYGPIKAVHDIGGKTTAFELEWCAKRPSKLGFAGGWRHAPEVKTICITREVRPVRNGQMIRFYYPAGSGYAVIFPSGSNALDPSEVEGLRLPA